MPSIAAAEAQLRAADRPVLFLDTCIIVDIIRATMRCMGTHFVQRAVELRGLLKSAPPGCALVVASVVPTEWGNHAPKTRDEVRGHLAKIQEQARALSRRVRRPGLRPGIRVAGLPGRKPPRPPVRSVQGDPGSRGGAGHGRWVCHEGDWSGGRQAGAFPTRGRNEGLRHRGGMPGADPSTSGERVRQEVRLLHVEHERLRQS